MERLNHLFQRFDGRFEIIDSFGLVVDQIDKSVPVGTVQTIRHESILSGRVTPDITGDCSRLTHRRMASNDALDDIVQKFLEFWHTETVSDRAGDGKCQQSPQALFHGSILSGAPCN